MRRIALHMLMGDTGKYFGIVAGVMFASLLLVQQLAMFAGIMQQMYSGISAVNADIWVMDQKVRYIDDSQPMTDGQLGRVRSVEGVAWAVQLYKGSVQAKLEDGTNIGVALYGLDDTTFIGGPARMVEGKLSDLRQSEAVVVDVMSAMDKLAHVNKDGTKTPLKAGETLELNDHRVIVAGFCEVARGFQSMPVVYTTYNRALSIVPSQRKNLSYILAAPQRGQSAAAVAARVGRVTGLAAYTSEQFVAKTLNYFLTETSIVINFGLSAFIAFLIGTLIAGQTFYNFTMDNLRHFGALKAMGAGNGTLLSMILLQAALVGALGYGTGTGLACLMGLAMQDSMVSFTLPWYVLVATGVVVVGIVTIAAAVSLRKVIRLEPGIVFRG
ncbi:ABC transporter permease [Paludibaculum fermentans]|uniref:ABC transporter permease n=1 Tax=Paludibaculum fermentans TaxID=1473598 RepID=UPI003EBE4459